VQQIDEMLGISNDDSLLWAQSSLACTNGQGLNALAP
jgi:hypothetical protein